MAAAAATGALRRVLLPAIKRRLTTGTGKPLISFADVRAGTTKTKAHQAEVAARRHLRKQKMREYERHVLIHDGGMLLALIVAPFALAYCWSRFKNGLKPEDCSYQSGFSSPASYES